MPLLVVFYLAVATGNLLDIEDYTSAVVENVDNHIEPNNNNHNIRLVRSSPGQIYTVHVFVMRFCD